MENRECNERNQVYWVSYIENSLDCDENRDPDKHVYQAPENLIRPKRLA